MKDVLTFPLGEHPTGEELDRLRSEFVQYQFGFHQFSDHYAVVARFAWEKMREAVRDSDRDRVADETGTGSVGEADRARARKGIAMPQSASPNPSHPETPHDQ